ncbi:MAG: glycosyltransferase family 4 protein [Candidatus Hydrogenedentota bacterium]
MTHPLRILMLNYEYPPLGGGAGNATHYLLREFAAFDDLHITLVTSSTHEARTEHPYDNITIHFLDIGKRGNLHYQTNRDLLAYSWKAWHFCRTLFREQAFDLIFAFFGIPCGVIAYLLGAPYIISLRGSDVPGHNVRFKLLDRAVFRTISRIVWKKAAHVTALSKDLRELAHKTSSQQEIQVIHNGISCEEFRPNEIARGQNCTLLFVGRLIEQKGVSYLLRAMAKVRGACPNLHAYIVGDGPLREDLRAEAEALGISGQVSLEGYIPHGNLLEYYQKADVFVLPSLNEALGNVTHEALASGLPIVTTHTGAAELVDGNGIVVPKKDACAIARAIERLLHDRSLRDQMAKQSRLLAETMTWRKTAEAYYNLFSICRKPA